MLIVFTQFFYQKKVTMQEVDRFNPQNWFMKSFQTLNFEEASQFCFLIKNLPTAPPLSIDARAVGLEV